jgi:hypothetical protein
METRKLKALALAVLLLVATVGVAWYFFQERGTPVQLLELDSHSFPNLKDAFNRAAESTRLFVHLSPKPFQTCDRRDS